MVERASRHATRSRRPVFGPELQRDLLADLLALVLGLVLLQGCATSTVGRSLSGGDGLVEVESAWVAPDGRIEVFLSASLSGAYLNTTYQLTLARSELENAAAGGSRPVADSPARIVLPRSRLHPADCVEQLSKEEAVRMIPVQNELLAPREASKTVEGQMHISFRSDAYKRLLEAGTRSAVEFKIYWCDSTAVEERSMLVALEPDTTSNVLAWVTLPITFPSALLLDSCMFVLMLGGSGVIM